MMVLQTIPLDCATNSYEPLHWQYAMVYTAGFSLVEHFTAEPDGQSVNDAAMRWLMVSWL